MSTAERFDLPKRLLVPFPRGGPGQRLEAAAGVVLDVPRWRDPAWACTTPGVLPCTPQELPGAGGGSVDLTGRPWNEVAPPPDESVLGEAPRPRAPGAGRPEVPLWQRLTYALQPPAALLLQPRGPLPWPGALYPYQREGVGALLSRETLLLADDMGLGKTVQAAAALRVLALRGQVQAALLITPASLLGQWRRALHAWAPELRVSTVRGPAGERAWQWSAPAHVYLTGYETFRADGNENPHAPPRRRLWDLVILDEAQRIKNRGSELSRRCKLLRRRRAWALTGTPIENSLDDLASVLEFVTPHRDGGPRAATGSRLALLEKLRTLQLRRRKADVLPQLPPKTVTQVRLPLTGAQRESYARAERDGVVQLRERGRSIRVENVLDLITRLKQICNFCPATGQSAKLEDLHQRLTTLGLEGHRALVFSQFVDARYGALALAARLAAHRPLRFTGDLSVSEREAVLRRFREDPTRRVLVLSLRAGGHGLNLQEASYVFHFDRWWNPAMERQAEDRSHRLGQTGPVHVYAYLCEGTIEERIAEVLRRKQTLFAETVDDVTLELPSLLSQDELFGLFGL